MCYGIRGIEVQTSKNVADDFISSARHTAKLTTTRRSNDRVLTHCIVYRDGSLQTLLARQNDVGRETTAGNDFCPTVRNRILLCPGSLVAASNTFVSQFTTVVSSRWACV